MELILSASRHCPEWEFDFWNLNNVTERILFLSSNFVNHDSALVFPTFFLLSSFFNMWDKAVIDNSFIHCTAPGEGSPCKLHSHSA